ncbi:MAG: PTS sugar transporter subunit IIA [Zoogloeaceae bacterium]|nr:PTS sugar transporter subunit IIA [Zoogloeaceae bacterium]
MPSAVFDGQRLKSGASFFLSIMNPIVNILPDERVLLDVSVSGKKRLLEEAARLFAQTLNLDAQKIFENLWAREQLGSTGLGQGVAIPHGRIKGLREAAGAFVRLATPVEFDAPDKKPVSLVFVLLASEQDSETSLQILAALATCFAERAFREDLTSAPDAPAARALFANVSA